jgi:hypothetical protein
MNGFIIQGTRFKRDVVVGWEDGKLFGDALVVDAVRAYVAAGRQVCEMPEGPCYQPSIEKALPCLLTIYAVLDTVTARVGDVPELTAPVSLGRGLVN